MPTPAGPHLQLDGVSGPGDMPALRDVSLAVTRGEFLTLLGAADSGNATLLALLAGFAAPVRGEIRHDGAPITRLPAWRRGFGVMFARDALFPHLTVGGNIGLPLVLRRSKAEARARQVGEICEMLRLDAVVDAKPETLSDGERRRVALGRAIVFEPTVLLLHEPFAGLPQDARDALRADIDRVHDWLGATTLLATEDGADALALSDRIAMMRGGLVEQLGTPGALYENPATAFVAAAIGESNRLTGVVERREAEQALVRLDSGPLVEGRAIDPLANGERCLLCLRPERVAVAAVSAEEMGGNAIAATLIEAVYLGDHLRLRFLVGSGVDLVVKRPAIAGLGGLALGRGAAVAWQTQNALLFRAPP